MWCWERRFVSNLFRRKKERRYNFSLDMLMRYNLSIRFWHCKVLIPYIFSRMTFKLSSSYKAACSANWAVYFRVGLKIFFAFFLFQYFYSITYECFIPLFVQRVEGERYFSRWWQRRHCDIQHEEHIHFSFGFDKSYERSNWWWDCDHATFTYSGK
jgi:hypothetical protein